MDMREEFELHYAEEFSIVRGYKPSPEEMVSMRDGDGYGSDRGYLNGYWKGWQASRESLVVELPDPFWPRYAEEDEPGLCISTDLFTIEQLTQVLAGYGIRTK